MSSFNPLKVDTDAYDRLGIDDKHEVYFCHDCKKLVIVTGNHLSLGSLSKDNTIGSRCHCGGKLVMPEPWAVYYCKLCFRWLVGPVLPSPYNAIDGHHSYYCSACRDERDASFKLPLVKSEAITTLVLLGVEVSKFGKLRQDLILPPTKEPTG